MWILLAALLAAAVPSTAQVGNPNYDSTLAKRLGANDYGLKKYYLVILRTGTGKAEDKHVSDSLFAGHFANMKKMLDLKKLIVAGPIVRDDRQVRGIFVIDAASREELTTLLDGDLAIRAKLLEPDVYEWFGSAALPEYLPAADKIWKQ
jgi:uncharacterized protein YciI